MQSSGDVEMAPLNASSAPPPTFRSSSAGGVNTDTKALMAGDDVDDDEDYVVNVSDLTSAAASPRSEVADDLDNVDIGLGGAGIAAVGGVATGEGDNEDEQDEEKTYTLVPQLGCQFRSDLGGVVMHQVHENLAADVAGLKDNDVVLEVALSSDAPVKVKSKLKFAKILNNAQPGDLMQFSVRRAPEGAPTAGEGAEISSWESLTIPVVMGARGYSIEEVKRIREMEGKPGHTVIIKEANYAKMVEKAKKKKEEKKLSSPRNTDGK